MINNLANQSEVVLTKLLEIGNDRKEAENNITSGPSYLLVRMWIAFVKNNKLSQKGKRVNETTSSTYQIIEALDTHLMHEEDSSSCWDSDDENPEENKYNLTPKQDHGPLSDVL